MYSPNPNDDPQRHARHATDPYSTPATGASGLGSVIALLVIVTLIGGLIALSTIGERREQVPAGGTEAPAPESITGGTETPE